jgi:hypothetical protein
MPRYLNYFYIYPPRPKNTVSPNDIESFDNNTMICQPKLNGSNASIYTNGKKIIVMNRHGQRLTNVRVSDSEILSLYRGNGGWMILNCEYLNKSKSDETGQAFNHKFVIFDILCYDGDYLVGKTFEERVNLLDTLYDQVDSEKDYLYSISTNVYRVKSYRDGFKEFFDKYTPIDVIEGVVMKRCNAKLEVGSSELNNSKSQIKCRKSTKNYKY